MAYTNSCLVARFYSHHSLTLRLAMKLPELGMTLICIMKSSSANSNFFSFPRWASFFFFIFFLRIPVFFFMSHIPLLPLTYFSSCFVTASTQTARTFSSRYWPISICQPIPIDRYQPIGNLPVGISQSVSANYREGH